MPADLLARIAKALEENPPPHAITLGIAARSLLPEAAAALKIAVEALHVIADGEVAHFSPLCTQIARDALSRLTSAAECTCAEEEDEGCGDIRTICNPRCPIHGQPSGEGK